MNRFSHCSLRVLCSVLLNFVALHSVLEAQTTMATLSGTVMDSQGAVVADVAITVSSRATGLKRQTTTNKEGLFTIPLLPPGVYSLRAQREEFSVVAIEDLELPVAGQVSQDITLQVRGLNET